MNCFKHTDSGKTEKSDLDPIKHIFPPITTLLLLVSAFSSESELVLRKNEIRSFRLNVKYGAEYGASFDQKYGKSCKILFQIRGRSRIVFVSEV